MSNTVLKEFNDGVLLLKLNRPEKKNAFSTEQWKAFAAELDRAREDDDVVVVVITGAGNDFSSGQDLNDSGMSAEPPPYQICERSVVDFDKPLIAAAKGVAVGGGATILFHCDILYVGESFRMRLPFTSLGIAPEFGSSYLLQASIGSRCAAELILTSQWVDAERAVETRIATRKFKDDRASFGKLLSKAAEMAQLPKWGSSAKPKGASNSAHKDAIEAALEAEPEPEASSRRPRK